MWTSVKIATVVATKSVEMPLAAIPAVVGMVSKSMATATAVTVSTGVQLIWVRRWSFRGSTISRLVWFSKFRLKLIVWEVSAWELNGCGNTMDWFSPGISWFILSLTRRLSPSQFHLALCDVGIILVDTEDINMQSVLPQTSMNVRTGICSTAAAMGLNSASTRMVRTSASATRGCTRSTVPVEVSSGD